MACEKCWSDASFYVLYCGGSVNKHYERLLKEREDNPCSPKEQCGDLHSGAPNCSCSRLKGEINEQKGQE